MRRFWKTEEITQLREAYDSPAGVNLEKLAMRLGRTRAALACKAEGLGFSCARGKHIRTEQAIANVKSAQRKLAASPERRVWLSQMVKKSHKTYGHPRGMLGKKHSASSRKAISQKNSGRVRPPAETIKATETRLKRFGHLSPKNVRGPWRAEWVEIGGKRFFARSSWETIYAKHLEKLKASEQILDWAYEADRFSLPECRMFLPDFKVTGTSGEISYHEVKGWMDARSVQKLDAFKKKYPQLTLVVIRAAWFKKHPVLA